MSNLVQRVIRTFRDIVGQVWKTPTKQQTILFIYEELAELTRCVMNLEAPDLLRSNPLGKQEAELKLVMEFGDVMIMLSTLANQCGVNLNRAAAASMTKIYGKVVEQDVDYVNYYHKVEALVEQLQGVEE